MTAYTEYDETNPDEIAALFVGHRIVSAETGRFEYPTRYGVSHSEGRLTLDDGTALYLTGNDGGCACSAGCYPLEKVTAVANVITSARVHAAPDTDDHGGEGRYVIFVFADNKEINVAEFVGTDGNGYYGTGFSLTVVPAPTDV